MLCGLVCLRGYPFEEPGVGEGRCAPRAERGVLEGHAFRGEYGGRGLPRGVGCASCWSFIPAVSVAVITLSSFVSSSLSSSMRRAGHSSVAAAAAGMSSRCGVMRMAPDWGSSSQTDAGTVGWPGLAVRAARSSWPEGQRQRRNWPACTVFRTSQFSQLSLATPRVNCPSVQRFAFQNRVVPTRAVVG